MSKRQVEFVLRAPGLAECPEAPFPEVAFSGRSNVGKSSLINLLTGRKALAYVSGKPGHTRALGYYIVDGRWHLVDMPGYGYARVSQDERRRWLASAKKYLHGREQLAAVVQLVDIRVGITPDDKQRLRELLGVGKPICLAMTKSDKIPRYKHDSAVSSHLAGLGLPPDTGVVITSAKEGWGNDELWAWIEDHLPAAKSR